MITGSAVCGFITLDSCCVPLQFAVDASVVWSRKLALTLFTLFELTRWSLNKKRRILKKTRRRKPPVKMLS